MNRRGFLSFLAAAPVAAVVAPLQAPARALPTGGVVARAVGTIGESGPEAVIPFSSAEKLARMAARRAWKEQMAVAPRGDVMTVVEVDSHGAIRRALGEALSALPQGSRPDGSVQPMADPDCEPPPAGAETPGGRS